MKGLSAMLVMCFVSVTAAQAPAKPAQTAKPVPAARPAAAAKPLGNLAQVMRGILFPNSNLIFDAQSNDPGAPKKAEEGVSASARFSSIYTGWQVVENAAIALAESADLIMIKGRLCENGKPVPLQNADWTKFVQGLREAGAVTLKAARSRSQDAVIEASDKVAEACGNCHERYRDVDGGNPARCTP